MKKIIALVISFLSALFVSHSATASERALQGWKLIDDGAVVVDVRTPGEFAQGHLEQALNYPVQALDQHVGKLDKDAMIVLYCRSGARVERAIQYLKSQGFTKLHNAGGLAELEQAANPPQ